MGSILVSAFKTQPSGVAWGSMLPLRSRYAVLGATFALGIGGVLKSLAGPRDAAAAERQRPLRVDVERGSARLDEELAEVLARKRFRATSDPRSRRWIERGQS